MDVVWLSVSVSVFICVVSVYKSDENYITSGFCSTSSPFSKPHAWFELFDLGMEHRAPPGSPSFPPFLCRVQTHSLSLPADRGWLCHSGAVLMGTWHLLLVRVGSAQERFLSSSCSISDPKTSASVWQPHIHTSGISTGCLRHTHGRTQTQTTRSPYPVCLLSRVYLV